MAVQASERVLQLVEASNEIRGEHRQEAINLAREDIAEARALDAYLYKTRYWEDYADDDTLRSFLGILYLVHMAEQGAELPQVEHIHSLLQFGRELKAESFKTLPEDEDVRQALEQLWHQHCARDGIEVTLETMSKPMMRYGPDMVPSHPSRAPMDDLDLTARPCSTSTIPNDFEGAGAQRGQRAPKLFDLLDKVWGTDLLGALPSRVQGNAISKALAFVRECKYEELEKDIVSVYAGPFYQESKIEEDYDDEYDWSFDFTAKEAILILKAIDSVSPLFCQLILQRPPNSLMPHWMAVMTCTEHARLWLARVDLNVYYDQDLTYGELCTERAREAELQVLKSSFSCERAPSPLQRQLRLVTLHCLWSNLFDTVHNFRPQDFSREACESKLWAGLKKLGHPIVLGRGEQPDADVDFKPVAGVYINLLQYEDRRKVDWLFWEMGPPSAEELAQLSSRKVQPSKPTAPGCGIL